MDNKYISNVISEMKPFLNENGFKETCENTFESEAKKAIVEYSEERQMFLLMLADRVDGEFGEPVEVNAWLFDDSQNERDAEAVGIDFTESLRKSMGVTVKRKTGNVVDLPTASKSGVINIDGFAKRVLDIYPSLKDLYREHIDRYGKFLYMSFFADNLVPEIIDTAKNGNNKQKKKILDLCQAVILKGDKDTANLMIACVAAACYKDAEAKKSILEILSPDSYLKQSIETFIPMIGRRKLKAIFVK